MNKLEKRLIDAYENAKNKYWIFTYKYNDQINESVIEGTYLKEAIINFEKTFYDGDKLAIDYLPELLSVNNLAVNNEIVDIYEEMKEEENAAH